MIQKLMQTLADKIETKKQFKIHEKQIKTLFDLVQRGQTLGSSGGGNFDEQAMFTRRPLRGMQCASCEKDIFNIYGNKADYIPWNKLPARDPSERIARVGRGFSKMLALVNPENLQKIERQY
mmetsp:Transcript_20036/g.14743  ORF Transcript_20036/g.14743 Transcript_20036/m.14743 type:complete len:122 (+) Transcript_20036:672-1037(+)